MRAAALLLLVAGEYVYCAPQSGDLDDLITSTFGNTDPKPRVTGCQPGYECVPKYFCKDGELIPHRVITIRFGSDHPQPCPDYLQVCCNTSEKTTEPIALPRPAPEGCGFRNSNGIGGMRTTGDKHNESQYGEFPWMVAILEKDGNNYACGGSLIHPSVVLSAAHCVHGRQVNTLKIRAGEWDTQTISEWFPHQDRQVSELVTHEHYTRTKKNLYNDIALLFLKSPIEIAENVRTICLPPVGANFDYSRCVGTGWGKDVFGREGKYQVILKKIDLPVVPRDQCQTSLRTTHLGRNFELHGSLLCAGGEIGRDMCIGDGGSPLVCPIPGRSGQYYQVGIVAWGIGCGDEIPGVYASVPALRRWLDEHLASKGIESTVEPR